MGKRPDRGPGDGKIACYRFKRFTDSRRKLGNGKSPLELAGADLAGVDWLSFLLNR